MDLPRLLRTVRYLRPTQVIGQVRLRAPGRSDARRLVAEFPADGELPRVRWRPRAGWLHPDGAPPASDALRAGRLALVGLERDVGWPPDWTSPDAPRLWRYNLHFHGFLFGLEYPQARELVRDYVERSGPGAGGDAWEPYPTSLRAMSWLPLFFGRWRDQVLADPELAARLWLELRRMLSWIERRLETHLLANHLLENALALCLAGACFEGPDAERWRRRGLALLRAELAEQLLSDGAHYERSPMYQQRVLYGLGLLLNSGDEELRRLCAQPAARMLGWLRAMTHPDGGIALFNDAGLGMYPSTASLSSWLAELEIEDAGESGPGAIHLAQSGYFTARNGEGDALFMDAGEIGPSYQPGHAHADFLAVELSLAGRRFVVDGGNHGYVEGERREWARSARGHSTVFVDGEEPLELWASFRVGRRGAPVDVRHEVEGPARHRFTAAHTGYEHLSGCPRPRRELCWDAAGLVRIEDSVAATRARACTSQLRIAGDWEPEAVGDDRVRFRQGGAEVWVLAGGPLEREASRWFPGFHREESAHLLRQALAAGGGSARWVICRAAHLERAEAWLGVAGVEGPPGGGP